MSGKSRAAADSTGPRLRASYVWAGEVMADAVIEPGEGVSLGTKGKSTFVTADLGLPPKYQILRPGQSGGYVLTLAKGMTGTVSIKGRERPVEDLVGIDENTSFQGKNVGEGDWGVIRLDGSGTHELFFHFVKNDGPLPRSTWRDSELLGPAIAFAVIFHSILLFVTFALRTDVNGAVFPGKAELVADYLVRKPEKPVEEEEAKPGTDDGEEKVDPSSTVGLEGQAGGEGEEERARAPDPDKGEPDDIIPKSLQKGLLTVQSRENITKVLNRGGFDKKLGNALARLQGPLNNGGVGGFGMGTGTGVGDMLGGTGTVLKGGKGGPGGGGNALGDVVTQGVIKTGGTRVAKGIAGGKGLAETKVSVGVGTPKASGGLTPEEIRKVVFSRKRAYNACFTKELQRSRNIGGKLMIRWKISATGAVMGASVAQNSVGSGPVADCVVRWISRLEFPKPRGGQTAVVSFPFVFQQQ